MTDIPVIHCDLCKTGYPEALPGSNTNQGVGCAASFYPSHLPDTYGHIWGHYGSTKYDCIKVELLDRSIKFDNICDICITGLIDTGKAEICDTDFFVDFDDELTP